MRLPRDISGNELIEKLRTYGYKTTRQVGSHIRLTTQQNGTHHITVPNHDPIKIGTLSSILQSVATYNRVIQFIPSTFDSLLASYSIKRVRAEFSDSTLGTSHIDLVGDLQNEIWKNQLYKTEDTVYAKYGYKGFNTERNTYSTELFPNMPNPLKDKTIIPYSVGWNDNVKITLVNHLGKVIATIVDSQHVPGFYKVEFDATLLSSGVYYYQLLMGNVVLSKPMVVIH